MAVEFKDYYSVLGVPRDASEADIKKAFRRLAREYHPDVAKDKKSAEAKFKEINEAHEVLRDPAKRRRYDELGANWRQDAEPARGAAPRRPQAAAPQEEYHFGGTGFSDFFEQFFGGGRGGGFDEMFRESRTGPTGAFAEEPAFATRGHDVEGDILVTLDEALHGSMRQISLQRIDPRSGRRETETFTVRIPPGAREGRRIRVPGKGGPGTVGAEGGDLYLRVRLAAHPDFEVRDADLYHDLEVAPWEAVLGGEMLVPTLAGGVKLRVPPGTNNGRHLRIRGQGLPKDTSGARGDLYAVVNVQLPSEISAGERELWETLARTSHFRPRDR